MKNKAASIFVTIVLIVLTVIIVILGAERLGVFDKKDKGDIDDNGGQEVISSTQMPEVIEKEDVTMIFGGDFLLSGEVLNAYNKDGGNLNNIMGANLSKEFNDADIAMVNNEFPFSIRGEKAPDKQFTFRTDPKHVNILTEMGVDIVSLANNHVLDYGEDALVDTLTTLEEASILYAGAGNNLDEAKEIKYIEKNGKTIAILCASRVIPVAEWNATDVKPGLFTTYDPTKLVEQIKEAETKADISVVYVHWGLERKSMPEQYQRGLGKQYIDAGADLVIGAHSHCLQGMEVYNGKLITYSLGNFIFNGRTADTMALKANIDKENNISVEFIPCVSKAYQTEIATEDKYKSIIDYYKGISYDVDIDDYGKVAIENSISEDYEEDIASEDITYATDNN